MVKDKVKDKDIIQADKDYEELKNRLKGKRIDYKKMEDELLEMMGPLPPKGGRKNEKSKTSRKEIHGKRSHSVA